MAIAVRGRDLVQRYLRELPGQLEKLLVGAGRAGGRVVADEAARRSRSRLVAEHITVTAEAFNDHIRVRVDVKGQWPRSIAIWLEFGTSGHFLSVNKEQTEGETAKRVNDLAKKKIMVINGKPISGTVWHPGTQPEAFLRPANDASRPEAIAAGQAHIDKHVRGGAILAGFDDISDGEGGA